jgi:uncharacterized membrane protein HdeD (DUF308 family)
MSGLIGWLWIATGVLGIVDAFRHSESEWAAADRKRAFWVVFMFFFGPIFVTLYALVVRPRFGRAGLISDEFRS